jgi:hypothetical protein
VDEAVQNGIVQPRQYLILDFDFSRARRSHNMSKSEEGLRREINYRLEAFKRQYSKYLGPSFRSGTASLDPEDPGLNLWNLVDAVQFTLQNIHDRGEKDNPLWDVLGVCFFWTTIHYNMF